MVVVAVPIAAKSPLAPPLTRLVRRAGRLRFSLSTWIAHIQVRSYHQSIVHYTVYRLACYTVRNFSSTAKTHRDSMETPALVHGPK